MISLQQWFQPGDRVPYSGKVIEVLSGTELEVVRGQWFPAVVTEGGKYTYLVIRETVIAA